MLRRALDGDLPLLHRIFVESHCHEFDLLALDPAARARLIELQLHARAQQYAAAFPQSRQVVVESAGVPVGSCWTADETDHLRVLDVAVLGEFRRRGIATAVMRDLGAQAARTARAVRLAVWPENRPAVELYRSLGFAPASSTRARAGRYLELEWWPDPPSRPHESTGAPTRPPHPSRRRMTMRNE